MTTVKTAALEPWLACAKPNRSARLRLFCIPFSGGNASLFHRWHEALPDDIEVFAVEMPGSLRRAEDKLYPRMEPLIDVLEPFILPHLDRPFAIFGSCTGAFIGYALCRRLLERHGLRPRTFFACSMGPPHLPRRERAIHGLPEKAFVSELNRMGGTPSETLAQPELMRRVLPGIRAGFELAETYFCGPGPKLDCRIVAIGGWADQICPPEDVEGWQALTSGPFQAESLPGNHFLLESDPKPLLDFLRGELEDCLDSETGSELPLASDANLGVDGKEGFLPVTGGRVWYRIAGAHKPGIPLLVLHGGPGTPHDYLEPLTALGRGRPVIFYDQLGCGRSEKPHNPMLWQLDRFLEELQQVMSGLGLERVHFFGHSWGSILAVEHYYLRPESVASLVLCSPCLSIPHVIADMKRLARDLPEEILAIIRAFEAEGKTESAEFKIACMAFYQKHMCRLSPFPPALLRAFENKGDEVYRVMWGPSELTMTGSLRNHSSLGGLDRIRVPALLMCGRYDQITPETTRWYHSRIPESEFLVFENSAHFAPLEDERECLRVTGAFLKRAEQGMRAISETGPGAEVAEGGMPLSEEPEVSGEVVTPCRRGGSIRLSFAQERLWFLDRLFPGQTVYHLSLVIPWTDLDQTVLQRALDALVLRHEALRTNFRVTDGHPVQVIAKPARVELPLTDLSGYRGEVLQSEANRIASMEVARPFDLALDPLFRARLIRLDFRSHWLVLAMHHIVSDGWSLYLIQKELVSLYRAIEKGEPDPLPELPIQYADFAVWQRRYLKGEVLDRLLAYWLEALEGASPVLYLPCSRPRPAVESFRGASQHFALSAELTDGLKQLGEECGSTMFMTLLAGFFTLIHRYSGEADFLVGSPIANRNRLEIEDLVGFFVNELVLRADFTTVSSFRDLLERVKATTLAAYSHQDLPFEMLVDALKPPRDLNRQPLVQVSFVLQNAPAARTEAVRMPPLDRQEEMRLQPVEGVSRFDLTLAMTLSGETLTGACEYNTDLFEHATVGRMMHHFALLLKRVAADPEGDIRVLPLASETERLRLLNSLQKAAPTYGDRPIGGAEATRFLVLDRGWNPVPPGIVGAVHFQASGDSGNDPHPGNTLDTGFLGKYGEGGTIEVLGAKDRYLPTLDLDLDKLEEVLCAQAEIESAHALLKRGSDGRARPAVYFSATAGERPSRHVLFSKLRKAFPEAAHALVLIPVDSLEKLNGSVSPEDLPDSDLCGGFRDEPILLPRTETEIKLAEIWSEVLDREQLGMGDNFFDLGGNSLNSVRILSRVRDVFGTQLPLHRIFETPTIAGLAATLDQLLAEETPRFSRPQAKPNLEHGLKPMDGIDLDSLDHAEVDALLLELMGDEEDLGESDRHASNLSEGEVERLLKRLASAGAGDLLDDLQEREVDALLLCLAGEGERAANPQAANPSPKHESEKLAAAASDAAGGEPPSWMNELSEDQLDALILELAGAGEDTAYGKARTHRT